MTFEGLKELGDRYQVIVLRQSICRYETSGWRDVFQTPLELRDVCRHQKFAVEHAGDYRDLEGGLQLCVLEVVSEVSMPEFWYHASLEESVEIARRMMSGFGLRLIHLPLYADYQQATDASEPMLLDRIDDALMDALRGELAFLWFAAPGITPRVTLTPAKSDPAVFVLKEPMQYLSFQRGQCVNGRGGDSAFRAPNPTGSAASLRLENLFDDLVEKIVKKRLVQVQSGGARHWVSPSVQRAMGDGRGLSFGGVLPRLRSRGLLPTRFQHEPPKPNGPRGFVRVQRGTWPAITLEYEVREDVYYVRVSADGPDERVIELLEHLGSAAQAAHCKMAPADERIAFLLGEERRFSHVRAPAARSTRIERDIPVPVGLARLCRDAVLWRTTIPPNGSTPQQRRFVSPTGFVEWSLDGESAKVSYSPTGRLARPGFETDVRWGFEVPRERLEQMGRREITQTSVTEAIGQPDAASRRLEIERIFVPLLRDGALRFVTYSLDFARLSPLVVAWFEAIDPAAREQAFDAIVHFLVGSIGARFFRIEELLWALEQPSLGAETQPRTVRLPDCPSPLSSHPELARIITGLRDGTARVVLSATRRTGGPARIPVPASKGSVVIEEVLPYLRPAPRAPSMDTVEFEIELSARPGEPYKVVAVVSVPRRALRAIPSLRALGYGLNGPRGDTTAGPVQYNGEHREPWSISIRRRAGASYVRTLTLHASGMTWFTDEKLDSVVSNAGAPGSAPGSALGKGIFRTPFCVPVERRKFLAMFEDLEDEPMHGSVDADADLELTKQWRRGNGEIETKVLRFSSGVGAQARAAAARIEALIQRADVV
ncbi:MAG: hypothetical protein U0271_30720 [Polyangiaceae bacterium]